MPLVTSCRASCSARSFLPWCKQTDIHERTHDLVIASIHVSKGVFNKSFTTKNYLQQNRAMRMELVDGPFEAFHALWQFDVLEENACRVVFSAEFRFANRMLDTTHAIAKTITT